MTKSFNQFMLDQTNEDPESVESNFSSFEQVIFKAHSDNMVCLTPYLQKFAANFASNSNPKLARITKEINDQRA